MQPFALGTEPRIVFEDECILAVYKPPRLHCAAVAGGGKALTAWVFEQRPQASFDSAAFRNGLGTKGGRSARDLGADEDRSPDGGLFHRLDFETSGLVLFALDPATLESLLGFQDAGLIEKTYTAFATASLATLPGASPPRGRPSGLEEETWVAALERAAAEAGATQTAGTDLARLAAGRGIESRFRPFGPGAARVAPIDAGLGLPRGKGRRRHGSPAAVYRSEVAAVSAIDQRGEGPRFGVEVVIRRGFRHQIRAHLAWIGLPLAGDALYGGLPFERLCLHASRLRLPQPRSGEALVIDCPAL